MSKEFKVRDPVHDFISLRGDEVGLIDTSLYQRLRGIKQLALASLVYPGALHTRFDHSLGVCHVAGLMAKQLGLKDDDATLVRLAALLHDVGHGPFSHVSENLLDFYADRSKLAANQKKEKIHELVTASLIRTDSEITSILGTRKCDLVATLLADGHGQPALKNIVSGPLDADKQDYLLRDSYFCGVAYGTFDIHQLHRSLTLGGSAGEEELMIKAGDVHSVEQFVLAKYYMTANVYRHRVRQVSDQMIIRAIRLGIDEDQTPSLRELYSYDGTAKFITNYRQWDDARFMTTFVDDPSGKAHCAHLLRRLRERRLFKQVFACALSDIKSEDVRAILKDLHKPEHRAKRAEVEKSIAEAIAGVIGSAVEHRYVILHVHTIKSVRESSRNDESEIMVAKSPMPRSFEDESTLFASINEKYAETSVEVYAPVAWNSETKKQQVRDELKAPIVRCIDALGPSLFNAGTVPAPAAPSAAVTPDKEDRK